MNDGAIGKAAGLDDGLFRTLVDLLPDYFYVLDAEARFVYVNQTGADYFRLPKAEIVGKSFEEVEPHPETARRFLELSREIMDSGGSRVTDTAPYPEPDGTLSYYRRFDIAFRHPTTGEPMLMGMAQDTTDRVERERQGRRLAALHREMEIAQEIQRSLLPKDLRADWVDLAGFNAPAAYAGGDFYDWSSTPDGSIVLALGDVSGHGVGPALVAAECRAYWRSLAPAVPLREAVLRLNDLILDDLAGDRFVTLVAARLAPDGALEVFSAGHGPLVILRDDGTVERLDPHTIPLGVVAEPPGAAATTRRLGPGDALLMFSDGVTETRNPAGELWNTDGLLAGLARHRGRRAGEILHAIDQRNQSFAAGQPPEDDRTVVVATLRKDHP